MSDSVRSIIYFWWRKSEENLGLIKFGDHTENILNSNWYNDTVSYIQKTAAPREKNTFNKLISYFILDVTEFAKSVNKNYKLAKIDNYITSKIDFEKYRLGKTDQFQLPKFEYNFEDFIDIVKDFTFVKPVLELSIPQEDFEKLLTNKTITFNSQRRSKQREVLSIIDKFKKRTLIITEDIEEYVNTMKQYKNFENYKVYYTYTNDNMFMFMDSITFISPKDVIDTKELNYNTVVKEVGCVEVTISTIS